MVSFKIISTNYIGPVIILCFQEFLFSSSYTDVMHLCSAARSGGGSAVWVRPPLDFKHTCSQPERAPDDSHHHLSILSYLSPTPIARSIGHRHVLQLQADSPQDALHILFGAHLRHGLPHSRRLNCPSRCWPRLLVFQCVISSLIQVLIHLGSRLPLPIQDRIRLHCQPRHQDSL